jgi:xanthine dehydrogenase accessory factor
MSTLLEQVDRLLQADRPLCYTALVETRGSAPQKPGATMLVFHDGTQLGTLGGGCVEAEVKQRALRILFDAHRNPSETSAHQEPPKEPLTRGLLTFHLDHDYGWDDGLICGGRMKMLVDPVFPGDDLSYFRRLRDDLESGRGCTEAVVLEPDQAGGGTEGDRLLIDQCGLIVATRQTADLLRVPSQVLRHLKPLSDRPRPYVVGGFSFLPHLQRCRLIIVGAGHVGQRVAGLATDVGFDVWVIDDRDEYCHRDRFPTAKKLIVNSFETALSRLEIDSDTYCIIVTRGHHHDEQALLHLAETPARYVGMIGSRRKIKMIFDDLIREGISREALARVSAPLGINIGSQTVEEIAISIVAELIAHRNLGALPQQIRPASVLDQESV